MPSASYLQSSFLGGEWSPYAQGRMDDPNYRTGMNVCRNVIPVEEGAATRRPGTRLAAATRSGAPAVLRTFDFEQQHPYSLELTQEHLRFFSGAALVSSGVSERLVTAASTATPAVVTVAPDHDLADNDQVYFRMDDPSAANASLNVLLGREFIVTVLSASTFSIRDALTNEPLDGTGIALGTTVLYMEKILDLATPYQEADLQAVNKVQDQENLLLLHGSYVPYLLESTQPETATSYAVFEFGPADLLDGPYLDPVADAAVITASGTTGSVTLTISGGTTRWQSTDVGRLVRLYYEPAAWDAGTAYAADDKVKYNDAYYIALKASTGAVPESSPVEWGVDTTAAAWTWAEITAFTSSTVVTATIRGDDLVATTPAISTWRLGLFSDTTGYPTNGVFHEGRLWLAGVIGNRLDSSKSNDILNFSPTAPDGTVADDNACSYVFRATDVNQIFWMQSDEKGIVCGTQAGEWVVRSSQQDDPLTPTSVQARRVTKEGCANIPAVSCKTTIAYVQRWGKTVNEFLTTDVRGYASRALSATGKHLTADTGVAELAFQNELAPILWARTNGGSLIGCTYQRSSPFANDPPDFAGWHRHDLGNSFEVVSIQTGPSFGGDLDALSLVAKDPATGYHYVYVLTDIFEEHNEIADAYFVDMGVGPAMFDYQEGVSLTLYGMWRLEGQEVAVFVAGIDMGDFTVTSGTITVPIGAVNSLLTTAWINSLSSTTNFRGFGLQTRTVAVADFPDLLGVTNLEPWINESGLAGDTEDGFSAIDWDLRRMYLMDITGGLRSVNMDTWTQIHAEVYADPPNYTSMTVDGDHRLIAYDLATNASELFVIDKDTLQVIKQFGVASASFSSSATRIAAPHNKVCLQPGGRNFLVNSAVLISEIAVFDLDFADDGVTPGISWTGFSQATAGGDAALLAFGKNSGNLAWCYVIDRRNGANGASAASAYPVNIYRVVVSSSGTASMVLLGSLDMDALFGTGNWRHYNNITDVVADETPGHEGILIQFHYLNATAWNIASTYNTVGEVVSYAGHDWSNLQAGNTGNQPDLSPTFWEDMGVSWAGLNTGGDEQKLVKVETTGASLAVTVQERIFGFSVSENGSASNSRVRHGRYGYMGTIAIGGSSPSGSHRVWDINTVTGAVATYDVYPFTNIGPQWYNDATGDMVFQCAFTGQDVTPDPGYISPVATGRAASWGLGTLAEFTKATAPYLPAIPPPNDAFLGIPVAIGFTYTSQGQILRPIQPQESGAANGPALGKTRRTHMTGFLMHKAQGVEVGTVFGSTRPAIFRTAGGTSYALTSLFSGIYQTTIEDDYSFDSMVCWEITRPYPATMLAIGPDLHTQDR